MTQLTHNFSMDELIFSDTAVRNGIDNTAPENVVPRLFMLADGLERVRTVLKTPVHVNSGYRCESLEHIVAAKDFIAWSRLHGKTQNDWPEYYSRKVHPKGGAADFVSPKFGTPREIVAALDQNKDFVKFDKLICEGTWVHIQFADKPRGEVMTATFDSNGVPRYTEGLA